MRKLQVAAITAAAIAALALPSLASAQESCESTRGYESCVPSFDDMPAPEYCPEGSVPAGNGACVAEEPRRPRRPRPKPEREPKPDRKPRYERITRARTMRGVAGGKFADCTGSHTTHLTMDESVNGDFRLPTNSFGARLIAPKPGAHLPGKAFLIEPRSDDPADAAGTGVLPVVGVVTDAEIVSRSNVKITWKPGADCAQLPARGADGAYEWTVLARFTVRYKITERVRVN